MVEQLSLDGKSDLAWLLTLQHDPPASIFRRALPSSGLRPFSPGRSEARDRQSSVRSGTRYAGDQESRILQSKASPCPSSEGKGKCFRAGGGTTPHAQAAPCQTVVGEESCRRQGVGHGAESATACPPGAGFGCSSRCLLLREIKFSSGQQRFLACCWQRGPPLPGSSSPLLLFMTTRRISLLAPPCSRFPCPCRAFFSEASPEVCSQACQV